MEVIVERPAALDVHKATVTACVRVPDEHGVRVPHLTEFQTTVRGLLALRDWLAAHRVFAGRDGGHRGVLEAGGAPRGAVGSGGVRDPAGGPSQRAGEAGGSLTPELRVRGEQP